jgi:hypothetical protein
MGSNAIAAVPQASHSSPAIGDAIRGDAGNVAAGDEAATILALTIRLCRSNSPGDPPAASNQPERDAAVTRNSHPFGSDSIQHASGSALRSSSTGIAAAMRDPKQRSDDIIGSGLAE